jgi:N-dimethylarginine dimethylaminohydrolase
VTGVQTCALPIFVVRGTVVTNTGCDDLRQPLADRGYELRMVELSEFMKSGGSAKCLTLRLA